MRLMVGAIASGPMYFSTRPTRPEKPRTIWRREDTRMAPWICGRQVKRDTTQTHKPFLCTQLNIAVTRKIKTCKEKNVRKTALTIINPPRQMGLSFLSNIFCFVHEKVVHLSTVFFFLMLFGPTVSPMFQFFQGFFQSRGLNTHFS